MFSGNSNHLWPFVTVKVDAYVEHFRKQSKKIIDIILGKILFQTSYTFFLLTKTKLYFMSLCFFFLFSFLFVSYQLWWL